MHRYIKFILFWNDTLHVSDGLSAVQNCTYSYQTDTAVCLLASSRQCLFDKCLFLYVQFWTADDGRKDSSKRVECYSNQIHLRNWCIWLYLLWKVWDNLAPTGFGTANRPPRSQSVQVPTTIYRPPLENVISVSYLCHQSTVSCKFRCKPHTGYLFILIVADIQICLVCFIASFKLSCVCCYLMCICCTVWALLLFYFRCRTAG